MPFQIVRNDIANMQVDAIVNTANPMPVVGQGVDSAIHEKAGPRLLETRKRIGRLSAGQCVVTPGFDLPAKHVIHAVGPVWRGGLLGEGRLLRRCYESALKLALEHSCESIAFPLISSGTYGFPKDRALRIATTAIQAFLEKHDMTVYLVVYDRESFGLSEKLVSQVASYIDENYIDARPQKAFGSMAASRRRMDADRELRCESAMPMPAFAPKAASTLSMSPKAASLDELLAQTDAGFSETLLDLIDKTGQKDSEIYKRANVSRQHFSKIRNDPQYKPKKVTALAFAIALRLDLEQTRDLIGRAGFALTRASKFDVILMYFIENRRFDILEINTTLFEFDQPLLGA